MPKLLIVEDENHIRTVLEMRLETEYELKFLSEGTSAHETIKQFRPNLVVLDLMLPGKTGLEILEELKNDSETSQIPAIICSAKFDKDTIQRALQLGANRYIVKPFDMDELIDGIQTTVQISV